MKVLIAGGGCFLSFSNHKNYSIKNISVCSKSKIKTKVTSKQNPEHFKMINRRLFIHKSFVTIQKCCCYSLGQKLLERLSFRLHQAPFFLRLSTFDFHFFSFFDSFLFCTYAQKKKNNYIVIKIEKFQLCFTICFGTAKQSHSFLIQS